MNHFSSLHHTFILLPHHLIPWLGPDMYKCVSLYTISNRFDLSPTAHNQVAET